jgi:hypothetical protein
MEIREKVIGKENKDVEKKINKIEIICKNKGK